MVRRIALCERTRMGRSALFSSLRRLLGRAHVAATGKQPKAPAGPSRREIFHGMLASAALVPLVAACGDNRAPAGAQTKSIAIVGGGIAGMTCAHFLSLAGLRADIFEASMRIGGRTYTQREGFASNQLVELGGELVDTDHIVLPALARTFGKTLDDLPALTDGLVDNVFYFNGKVQDEATLVAAFTPVAAKMAEANAMADDATFFAMVDNMSIHDWLTNVAGLADTAMIKQLLELAYVEEFGLEVAQQSAWNLLTLIDYDNPDPFRIFGDSDERYHLHQGSDSIALAIADDLADWINLDHALTKVAGSDAMGFDLTFATGGGDTTLHYDHVVYALPFTKLREVDLTGAGLSAMKTQIVQTLGYGTNAKLMMQFSSRPWEDLGSAGGCITDAGAKQLQTTWSTSRGQDGAEGIMTNFVGGQRGIDIGTGTSDAQVAQVLPWLDILWPGTSAKYNGKNVRQHWPSYPFNKGSYACYTLGQWSYFGLEGKAEGNQHFCGEHTSEDFQGYMEGGAETGAMVAAELCDALDVRQPDILAGLLSQLTERRSKPRASYHSGFGRRMSVRQRRRFGVR